MKTSKKSAFWCAITLYTIGYLYFYLSTLEECVYGFAFYKSALGKLSPYFYGEMMFVPAIVCGILVLTGCIMLTKIIYGQFRRGVALLPIGGIVLQICLHLLFAVLSVNAEARWAYTIPPIVLFVYLLLTWILCLSEYKHTASD